MARATAIDIDAPLSAGIRRGVKKNLKKTPIKRASMGGIKKRFSGGKPSGGIRRQSGGPVARRQSGGFVKEARRGGVPSNENREVRINLSNLAATVLSSDLRELFSDFKIRHVSVNFNEKGAPAGTGDITLSKRHADLLIQKYSGVALDGKVMKFALIDTHNIANRVKFPDAPPRKSAAPSAGKPTQRTPKKQGAKPVAVAGKGAKKTKKPKRVPQPKKTVAELDAELDAYMASSN